MMRALAPARDGPRHPDQKGMSHLTVVVAERED